MSTFGKTSQANVDQGHKDLQLILNTGIVTCPVDFGVHNVGRSYDQQLEYFLNGSSTLDPRIPEKLEKAMHVITEDRPFPMAADFHVAEKHKGESLTWNSIHLTAVAFYLIAVADMLYDLGLITHKLLWGGNWDNDGVIQLDQDFDDNPHVQLYKP